MVMKAPVVLRNAQMRTIFFRPTTYLALLIFGIGILSEGQDQVLADESKSAAFEIYDGQLSYSNPLRDVPLSCLGCAHFFRVLRPLAPFINHVIIGVQWRPLCGLPQQSLIYGASKGPADAADFLDDLESKDLSQNLEWKGVACAEQARTAVETASRISFAWRESMENEWIFALRMAATPVMGRICAVAADEILQNVAALLQTNENQNPLKPHGFDSQK